MKMWRKLALAAALMAATVEAQEPNVEAPKPPAEPWWLLGPWATKPVPVFYSVAAETNGVVRATRVEVESVLRVKILQGKAEKVEVELKGAGEVTAVEGEGVAGWAIRREADGRRFLEVRTVGVEGNGVAEREWKVNGFTPVDEQGYVEVMHFAAGGAVGFEGSVALVKDGAVYRVMDQEGLRSLVEEEGRARWTGAGRLRVRVGWSAEEERAWELEGSGLKVKWEDKGTSLEVRMSGVLKVRRAGEALPLAEGLALKEEGLADGWHVGIERVGDRYRHVLTGDRPGEYPVEWAWEAPVIARGDWRAVEFRVEGGVVVPLEMEGWGEDWRFDPAGSVLPEWREGRWVANLPASGKILLGWNRKADEDAGALFYSTDERTEVSVSQGLVSQVTKVAYRILQGQLKEVRMLVEGEGELLQVAGEGVTGWKLEEIEGKRQLVVGLNREMASGGGLEIQVQRPLGAFPVAWEGLKFSPVGSLRHQGLVRVAVRGAMKVEVENNAGMLQVPVGVFPGGAAEGARQVMVYRFPAAERTLRLRADAVMPEVSVQEVTLHEMAESDRRLSARIELDVREAPLRDWEIEIPGDFAVAGVEGQGLADYRVEAAGEDSRRKLRMVFAEPLKGRHLLEIRLEKNQPAAAGEWVLPELVFPGVKSHRGFVAVEMAAGYRVVPVRLEGLVELPVDGFPGKRERVQLAYRMRGGDWSAQFRVEALGQSIQADVFHLYSLKEGAVSGSILINYFVVGSPATQWQLRVPEGLGNLELSGQHVGRDWRREGEVLTIPLARPVLGAGTLLLTFEQPMSARGGELAPGEVRPIGVQSERGYVQVVSPVQVKHDVLTAEGSLLGLQANELPAEYRLLSSAPTLGAWQYTSGDFRLGLKIDWHEPGQVVEQVVDRGELESRVSRDGQVVTDAVFYLKSRGRTVLGLRLPEGAELWEVEVAGESVNARVDGAETLIPLEVAKDPDEAVEVRVRYGLRSKSASRVELQAPVMHAPMVLGQWKVSGDAHRVLLPGGGDLEPKGVREASTGLDWLSGNQGWWVMLLLAVLAAGWKLFEGSRWKWVGTTLVGIAGVGAVALAWSSWQWREELPTATGGSLEYAMPVVEAGQALKVRVANLSPWMADLSWWGVALVAVGVALMFWRSRQGQASLRPLAAVLIFWGILMNPMGEMMMLLILAGLALAMTVKSWAFLLRPSAGVAAAWVLLFSLAGAERSEAQWKPMESMVHDWKVVDGRLRGEVEFRARGGVDENYLLLKSPAVLTSFEGQGWKLLKRTEGERQVYLLVAEAEGVKTGKATWEMPLAGLESWEVPTGVAAMQRAIAQWPEAGWRFQSEEAAAVKDLPADAGSRAEIWFYPADRMSVRVAPKQRDVAQEEVKYYAELSDLYLPGSGGVSGRHRVQVRPSQGVVRELLLKVGAGMTVTEVGKGPVGRWRFNPETRELRVALEPGQENPFAIEFATQSGDAVLPVDLSLESTKLEGAESVVGRLGLAFAEEAQAEKVEAKGLSEGNLEDFPADLVPADAEGKPMGAMNRSYRHLGGEAALAVRVVAVEPELRMVHRSLLTLGEDRTVWAADLEVAVSRAGVFRIGLEVPEGFEVEAVSGEGVAEWTESRQDGQRIVTLHLAGRTMGVVKAALSLAGPGVGATQGWKVPEIRVKGAVRQSGMLTVAPERGMQVRVVSRQRVSQIDPGEALKMQPGAMAFRMLEAGSELVLGVSRLDPWVSAQVLHEVTLREGQNLSRVRWLLKVENAAIKGVTLSLPGLDEATAATLRATGPAVGDLVPVAGEPGRWELRFQRGVIGETTVDLEYQMQTDQSSMEILPSAIDQVRQISYFMALRSGGRLELERPEAPRGWQKLDWAVVPEGLRQWSDGGVPSYVYRVAEVEGPLKLAVKRHRLAESSLRRVESGVLMTLVSPEGGSVTKVDLAMQVTEKGLLKLDLPDGAELYSVVVNEEGVSLVREGREWLFYVHPAPEGDRPATVRFVYTVPAGKGKNVIEGPRLNVPLENLKWKVIVPEGWSLAGYEGDFDREGEMQRVTTLDYQQWVEEKRREGKMEAQALLDQANVWMAEGDQLRAGQAFSKAARNGLLDDASNEDAQVQLRNLKTQQATLALNTRRQRLYLWNRAAVSEGNQQLEDAAMDNPLLQGKLNFDPSKYEQLLEGNSVDEASAMKEIARRIVAQQLAADPAPTAMEVTLAEAGTVATFTRSVQVEGGKPMRIELKLKPERRGGRSWGWCAGAVAALVAGWLGGRLRKAA